MDPLSPAGNPGLPSSRPLGASAAAAVPSPAASPAASSAPVDSAEVERRYFSSGNRVDPLVDGGEILEATLQMVREAREHVQVHLYDLSHPEILQALKEDAARGVRVRVILDPNGSAGKSGRDSVIQSLRNAGVHVARFKVDKTKRQIDHVKLLIVDGKKMIIGGMNGAERSFQNHDYAVRIEGRSLNYFNQMFETDWKFSRGRNPVEHPKVTEAAGDALVSGGITDVDHSCLAAQAWRAIDGAKKSIYLQMFFLSDKITLEKLIAAKNRGVDVRVMLDSSTVSWGESPNETTFQTLKAAGVPVRWFLSPKAERLHAKLALVDDDRTLVGSANWSYKGFQINREAGVTVLDRPVNSRFTEVFLHDWENRSTLDLAAARVGVEPEDGISER